MTDTQTPEVTGNPDDPREVIAQAANRFIAAVGAEAVPSDVAARIALAAGSFSGDLLKLLPDPDGDAARHFRLDPDGECEIICPECDQIVSISFGAVFDGSEGRPLDHDATLGDLIAAADAHVCGAGEEYADA